MNENRQNYSMIWIVGMVLLVYAMPKTLRRYSVLIYAAVIVAFLALGDRTGYRQVENFDGTPLPVMNEYSIVTYEWWGWIGVAGIAFWLYLWPKVRHHIDWHSYQTRPGIFSATRESERFSWLPPFGTVHEHGCNAPTRQDWADYRQQAMEATYGPEHQPMHVPDATAFAHLPGIAPVARKPVERAIAPKVVSEPPRATQRPVRREDHGVFVINDYREFDPETGE